MPRLGADVPRWYGETIGFWDKDTLITWTSNIQGWMVHGAFEYSNKMQTIEIYTPNRDAKGKFLGLNHEAIFYDPEALVQPIRIVRNYKKIGNFKEGDPYVFIECVPTIFPVKGQSDARVARHGDPIRSSRHVRPPVGPDLGEVLRAGHAEAAKRRYLHV